MYEFTLEGLTPLKAEPYPFSDLQKEWLKELRSGSLKQGQGFLQDKHGGFCCLGVLAKVAGYEAKLINDRAYSFFEPGTYREGMYGSTGYLPGGLTAHAGLNNSGGSFRENVQFPGVEYGQFPQIEFGHTAGHGSLAAMNDARCLQAGDSLRAFTFQEIADYIEFDPWNVFRDAS